MKGKVCFSNLAARVLILSFALFIGVSIFGLPQDTYAAVTALDAWTNIWSSSPNNTSGTINAGSLTVSGGSNRIFLAAVCLEQSSSYLLLTLNASLGGTALTEIKNTKGSVSYEHCYMGYLKESQIPAGSNNLTVQYQTLLGYTVTGIHVKWASYSDVNQIVPINDSNASTNAAANVTFGAQIDYIVNGRTLYIAANAGTPASMTAPTDFSQVGSSTTTNGHSSFIAATANHGSDGNYASTTTVNFGGTTDTKSAIVVAALNSNATVVGNGTNPTNATICPGAVATEIDAFTLQTLEGTDTVTGVAVTFSTAGFYERLSLVEITSDDGSTVYGDEVPTSDTVSISVAGMPEVTNGEPPPQYKVRITPKSHADMPAPPDTTYSSTGKVTGITSSNPKIYNDSASATITIDNASPWNPTSLSGIPGDEQVVLNWSTPLLSTGVVILRNTSSPITDIPAEGVQYNIGDPIGITGTTVIYVGVDGNPPLPPDFTDTELSNGQGYYYKIFGRDDCYNYTAAGYQAGPYTPGPVVTASSSGTQVDYIDAGDTAQYIGAAFTFRQSSGTPDTITALTISETGTAIANTKLSNVKVYYESGVDLAQCVYDGSPGETLVTTTSFDISDKIVLSSISIPVTMSPNYTCVYVVFDVDQTAVNNTTVDLQITSSADFTLSGGTMKDGLVTYPIALTDSTTINGSIVTLVKVGSFQSGISTGNVPITGVGFQPKAVIFYWTRQSSTGFSTGMSIGEGFAAGSPIANRGVADACDDNVSPTNCGRIRSQTYSIMFLSNGTPTISGMGSVTSFNPDGFTVNWITAPGINAIINYIAIGGDAITNANAGTINVTTTTGDKSFTGVGFQPDFVMFLSGSNESDTTLVSHLLFNTGFMTPTGQAAISVGVQDNLSSTGHSWSQQRTDKATISVAQGGTQYWLASYVSMNPDGFTLNFNPAPGAATPMFYLALKGGTHRVGSFTQPTTGTAPYTQDITTVGIKPAGLLMASFNRITDSSIAPEGEISIGAASLPTEMGTIWGESIDIINSDANMSVMTNKAIQLATSATIDAEADFVSFLPKGFRFNWTTLNDTTPREFIYWAIANNPTTVGDGTDPAATIGPAPDGALPTPTLLERFTLQTPTGSDTVTGVTLSLGSSGGLSYVDITSEDELTIYGSKSYPDITDTTTISLDTNINVTTALATYRVRIRPKYHNDSPAMPVPPGSSYTVKGTVTEITSVNTVIYNDANTLFEYVVIDNTSPSNPTNFNGNAGEGQVKLNWTNPFFDCSEIIILRRNTSPVSDIPVEGEQYDTVINNIIGDSTVEYVHTPCNETHYDDTEVINGQTYYYKIFAKDLYGNYSSDFTGTVRGTPAGPFIPGPYVTASFDNMQTQTTPMEAGDLAQYIGAAFRFQQSSGTAGTITGLTITDNPFTGTADANVVLTNVKVYYESGVASCTYDGTETNKYDTSFSGPPNDDKIVLSSIGIPLTLSPNFTCVYVVFDVDLLAVHNSRVDLEITSIADFAISGVINKGGVYPVRLNGVTTLEDTTPPGNITDLTVRPDDAQVIFNWTNPTEIDFVGVCIMRTTGIPPVPPPADCPADCSGGTEVEGATSYTDDTVDNGTTYSYRLCSYDEVPKYSTGVEVLNVMPSTKPILTYPAAPYNDGKDPDTGDTTTDFTFKVIYTDYQITPNPLGDPPASGYPKIYIGDNDGYVTGYTMSPDTSIAQGAPLRDGDYKNGEQYVYGPIGFGAAADLRFYFAAQAATGDTTLVTLPPNVPTDYSEGPSVYLLEDDINMIGEYNMVGVPKDTTGFSYGSVLGDDSGISYCILWDSYGLDTLGGYLGDYVICNSDNIVQGKGYYIYALFGYGPYRLDEPSGVENVTDPSVDIALDTDGGWTMISNPYNARIKLEDVKVMREGDITEYSFSQAVTNLWIANAIYKWEGSVSGYIFKAFNGSTPAVLEPWVGFFIYVRDTTPTTLRVYAPAP